jgi:hypothetical protein
MNKPIDITDRTNEAAITLLCSFRETVSTSAGSIKPTQEAFVLSPVGGKPRKFEKASGAVEVLRRISKKAA